MTNPPPFQPNYQTPQGPQPAGDIARKNRWWMVILRILVGTIFGAGASLLGFWIGTATQSWLLAGVPFLILFGVALVITIKYKRFGYTAGIIIGPFIAAACLVILMFIICAGSGKVV